MPIDTAAAHGLPGSKQVQMNTRIEEGLKKAGDDVLARLGYSPSVAVRGLWRYVVDNQDDAGAIAKVIEPSAAEGLSDAASRKVEATRSIRELFARTAADLGIGDASPSGAPTSGEAPSWDDLRDDWYMERLGREGA